MRKLIAVSLIVAVTSTVMAAESDIICYVNGEPLKASVVKKLMAPYAQYMQQASPKQINEMRQYFIQELIQNILFEQLIKEKNFVTTPEQVEIALNRRRKAYEENKQPGRPSFDEYLSRSGLNVEELKVSPTPDLAFECYASSQIATEDVRRIYETEKDSWVRARARHILIATRDLKTPEEKAAAKEKAEDIRLRILGGENFEDLAKENSDCPSKAQGGDLGFFPRKGAMVEPFAAAAYGLKTGETSEVITTQFGYHIIQTTEYNPAADATFEEAEKFIKQQVFMTTANRIFGEFQRKAKITVPERPKAPTAPEPATAPGPATAPTAPGPATAPTPTHSDDCTDCEH